MGNKAPLMAEEIKYFEDRRHLSLKETFQITKYFVRAKILTFISPNNKISF